MSEKFMNNLKHNTDMETPEGKFERISKHVPYKKIDRQINLTKYHELSKNDKMRCDLMVEICIGNILIHGDRDYTVKLDDFNHVQNVAIDIVADIFVKKGYHVAAEPTHDGPAEGTCYRIHLK